MIAFLKREKKLGGYRDDGKNVSLGYLGCSISEEYFKFVGIDDVEVGDSVLCEEHPQGVCIETDEDIKRYWKEQEVRYHMTDARKKFILDGLEYWKERAAEEDIETTEEQLEELKKYILPKVDFETENLYFAYC